jgi:hypothetical protein
MLQRAMKLSSDELFEANNESEAEFEKMLINLQSILESMSLDSELTSKASFDSSNIKQQSIEIVKINKQREELLFRRSKH